ncbi:glycosyltransferase family 9 protein [Microbispora cellulosiformans]|uniref:Glycosyltransferase family 9 protein n=1 Tax=Microbispora cellulosiformans TaxID=2614688 RepID=A0A5J5K014_9ACTN|nr:glycosyltransferase family 9 protein [Microbispora cellulosiformans]KAA9376900.1 glycosyltransferase family 9 protein [Microbispora cellulosiformans]
MALEEPGRPVLLALRGLGLGDLLASVPALRALRRAHPGHHFVLATPAYLGGLLPLIGGVDELIDVSGPGPVPYASPDVAVNLHGSGPESIQALRRTRPGRLLTHTHPAVPGSDGPAWNAETHERERWCSLLDWYGIAADPDDLALGDPGPGPLPGGEVVIHPGAAFPARQWPPDRFAQVAAELVREGHRVVVTGGVTEIALARHVAALAGLPEESVLAGRTNLPELAALTAHASLVVCGDTGMAHLATAVGTPSVILYGPIPPALWGPPPGRPHIALWAGRRGDPHGDTPSEGLLEIGVPEVLDAVRRLRGVGAR